MKMMRCVLKGIGLALLTVTAAHAQTHREVAFDIKPQPMVDALNEWAQQTGFQLISPSSDVTSQFVVSSINGTLSPQEALERLLTGTTLTYVWLNERAVVIREQGRAASPATWRSINDYGELPRMRTARLDGEQGQGDWKALPDLDSVARSTDSSVHVEPLQEIVVTGTHIRGVPPSFAVITLGRAEIERSGLSASGDLIRSLPQNYSGGNNPQVSVGAAPGGAVNNSVSGGTTPNLRGLGPNSTLTLVNGHRLGSDFGGAADVSLVPLSVIDHVDVMTDGASSIYGSDAVAGVVNFVLRQPSKGARTNVSFGAATEGGATEKMISQLFGTTWTGGGGQISYEHATQDAVYASDRDFASEIVPPFSLLPTLSRDSFFVGVEQRLSSLVSLTFDGLFTSRVSDDSTAYAPDFFVTSHDAVKQYVGTMQFEFLLPHDWRVTTTTSFADHITSARSLQSTGDRSTYEFGGSNNSAEIVGSGPVLVLPAGAVRLALGAGYRREDYEAATLIADLTLPEINRRRAVRYTFGELAIPLLSPANRDNTQRLDLNLSARREDYSDFGGQTVPKVGVVYAPIKELGIRASWGKSFRAPTLLDAYGLRYVSVQQLANPLAPAGNSYVLTLDGSNPELRPERARSWTFGIDYKPESIVGLSASATYFNIDYTNRLGNIPLVATALMSPENEPFLSHDPTEIQQQQLIAAATGGFFNFTDAPYDPATIAAVVDARRINVSSQAISGVDLLIDYELALANSATTFFLNGSYMEMRERLTPLADEQQIAGRSFNPPRFRGSAGLTWATGPWSVTGTIHYLDNALNTYLSLPSRVSSWTTVDAQLAYEVAEEGAWLSGMRTTLSVRNLLDRDPPFTEADSFRSGFHYDALNASPLGRFVSLQIAKAW